MTRWKELPAGLKTKAPKPKRQMNKLEARYAEHLNLLKAAGEVVWWEYEPLKFRLAQRTFFTPDFFVLMADGTAKILEIKGFLRDDAALKFKIAREKYPMFKWEMLVWENGQWKQILA